MSPSKGGLMGLVHLIQGASVSQIVTTLLILLVVNQLAKAFYRLYLHPLSKFPGSPLHIASRIPQHYHHWNGTGHLRIRNLHRKYGHIVRISPNEISFIHPQAWKEIHGHGAAKGTAGSKPEKNWLRYGKSYNGVESLISARTDADHSRMRKVFTPAFSDRALKQQEPLFKKYANLLVHKLREGIEADPNHKVDMVRMYNFTTFDVMGDLTFGEPLHMLTNAEYDPWVSIIFGSIKFGTRLNILSYYPVLQRAFKNLIGRFFAKKRYQHFQFSSQRVGKRLEKGRNAEGVDLWNLVLNQDEPSKGMTRDEMDANAGLFMVAGTETTATLLSGLTYLLLKNPEWMKKIVDEIRETFASSDDMTMEELAALPVLNACIKEAFRVYPPVPTGLFRQTPPDGSTVAGLYVPPNSLLSIPQFSMYTDAKNFKDPLKYLPQRWLGDKEFDSDEKVAMQPFSVGTRDCLGKNMAYHEMRLIASNVFYHFDLELCPESEKWMHQKTFGLWEKIPLMCQLKPVKL